MVIKDVLREELRNSLEIKKGYERELARLPRGSLIKKKIKGKEYYYLEYREKGKIKFVYKGKLSPQEVKKHDEIKKIRAKYRKLLSQVKKQIKYLEGILRGKEEI